MVENLCSSVFSCWIHLRTIKPVTYGQTPQGAYASLTPTDKGRMAVNGEETVLLPETPVICERVVQVIANYNKSPIRKRIGKGKHMVPILKDLLAKQELTQNNKERYQYHDSCIGNALYYSSDITKLPHYDECDPHFLWSDTFR